MKKYAGILSLCVLSLIFALGLCGCGGNIKPTRTPEPIEQMTPQPTAQITPKPTPEQPTPDSTAQVPSNADDVGTIDGEVSFFLLLLGFCCSERFDCCIRLCN